MLDSCSRIFKHKITPNTIKSTILITTISEIKKTSKMADVVFLEQQQWKTWHGWRLCTMDQKGHLGSNSWFDTTWATLHATPHTRDFLINANCNATSNFLRKAKCNATSDSACNAFDAASGLRWRAMKLLHTQLEFFLEKKIRLPC